MKSSADGKFYAMKAIDLKLMSQHERKLAENEVILLKVLYGPTIIRYFESFTENDTIHIIMECAEGGCLTDRINEYKNKGIPLGGERILSQFFTLFVIISLLQIRLDGTACNWYCFNA